MMFYPLALLGGIALFSSAAAKTVWDVEVSDQAADLIFTPPITVSQVLAGQPNRHTNITSHSACRDWGRCSIPFQPQEP
jgi:hypothetical protein